MLETLPGASERRERRHVLPWASTWSAYEIRADGVWRARLLQWLMRHGLGTVCVSAGARAGGSGARPGRRRRCGREAQRASPGGGAERQLTRPSDILGRGATDGHVKG